MQKLLFVLFLLVLSLESHAQYCTADNRFTEVEYFSIQDIDTLENQIYGSAPDYLGNPTTLLLDAYFPRLNIDSMPLRPAVMIIHGGGFVSGNKLDRRRECIALAQRGYVAISISYRLGYNAQSPQELALYRAQQDAQAALRYIVDQSATFGVDTNWLFIGGSSAGAITANNVVYMTQSEWEATIPGIEALLGSLDTSSNSLTNSFVLHGVFNNWGAAVEGAVQVSEMLPQIAFHGELDGTVAIDSGANGLVGSRVIHDALLNNGVCGELNVDPDGFHGVYTNSSGAAFRASRTSCFFKSLFCNSCTDFYTTDSIPPSCSVTTALEAPAMSTYSVYPNPVQDHFQVTGLQGGETFSLYNSVGTLLAAAEDVHRFSLGGYPAGIYVLVISDATRRQSFRLVKR